MKVTPFKQICHRANLQELLSKQQSKDKVRTREFVKTLLDTKQEALFREFLDCLYEQRKTENKGAAKKLFRNFSKRFYRLSPEEQRIYSDPFHKKIELLATMYAKATKASSETFADAEFKVKDIEAVIEKLKKDDYRLAAKQEMAVNRQAAKDRKIGRGLKDFEYRNEKDYPHSVVQLDHSPKMVIIGMPRQDRQDTLNRFFSVMIQEKVDVIIALNTASDWEEAIAYYEFEHLDAVEVDGYSISWKKSELLYEGTVAANLPAKIQNSVDAMSLEEQSEYLRSDKMKKYRPKVFERTFYITERATGEKRKLTQLHYENWPDRQASPDLDGWMVLLKRQLQLQKDSIAIHCQGGIGRTNAHAILTCLVSEANAGQTSFNVPLTMLRLKAQAPRLGGLVCGKRFCQIYEMLQKYVQG
ncbi:MAG: hypothetical protein JSR37_05070 [Verrucomicrobia bacterium]|nr:hypothetical protein [Verrucomicrobiota bacterium]